VSETQQVKYNGFPAVRSAPEELKMMHQAPRGKNIDQYPQCSQRIANPTKIKREQTVSEIRAKRNVGRCPICSGSGKCCAILAKFAGFSQPA
jgi:hypothetical protein